MPVEEFRDTINNCYQKYDTMSYSIQRIILPQEAKMEVNPKAY